MGKVTASRSRRLPDEAQWSVLTIPIEQRSEHTELITRERRSDMKRAVIVTGVAVLVAVIVSACASSGATDTESVKTEVEEIFVRYADAANAEDTDTWITLWDEDGIQMPPGAPAIVGRDAVYQRVRKTHQAMDIKGFAIELEEAESAGPWAYARGIYSMSMTPKAGGDTMQVNGKYLTIFRRQSDGSWKIYRDCFNPR
jgi:uncharacterized protein (TIGR02246 family)